MGTDLQTDPAAALKKLRGQFPELGAMSDRDFATTLADSDASLAYLKAYDPSKALAPPQPETSKIAGLLKPGNIDLAHRPVVKNADGSISTVRSMGVNIDGQEVLLPTVSDDGRIMTPEEAIDTFKRTGRNLGIFKDAASSTAYAQQLHQDQAARYGSGQSGGLADEALRVAQNFVLPSLPPGLRRLAQANAGGLLNSASDIAALYKQAPSDPFAGIAAVADPLKRAAQGVLPPGQLSPAERFLAGDKSALAKALAPSEEAIAKKAESGTIPYFDIGRKVIADTVAPLIPNPLNPIEDALFAAIPGAEKAAMGVIADGVGVGKISPVLRGFVQSGLLGATFTATHLPEDHSAASYLKNVGEGLAAGIILHGAGAGIDEAAQQLGIGKVNAYQNLRQTIIDQFVEKGVAPKEAAGMTDFGIDQAVKTGGSWADVTAKDLRAAKTAVENGEKIIIGKPVESPVAAPPPELADLSPLSPAGDKSVDNSPRGTPPTGLTTVDAEFLGGPEGVQALKTGLPGLATQILAKDLPYSSDVVMEAIQQAAAIKHGDLTAGVKPADAEINSIKAFQDYLNQQKPIEPANPAPLPGAAPGVTKPALAAAMGVEPHQMPYAQFKAIYGEGVPEEHLQAVYKETVQKALDQGADVPPSVAGTIAAHETPAGYSVEEAPKLEKKAIDEFGTTNNLEYAGYLLRDGKMLNFNKGDPHYSMEHGEIAQIFKGTGTVGDDTDLMHQFMEKTAAARVVAYDEASGPHLSVETHGPLTSDQLSMLGDYLASKSVKTASVDLVGPTGQIVRNKLIDNPMVEDFARFFNGSSQLAEKRGAAPAQTELALTPYEAPAATLPAPDAQGFRALRPARFETKFREIGAVVVPNQKISSPADLAFVFKQFRTPAQENFYMIAVKKGRIVAVEHLGFGTISQVAVYPFNTLHLLEKTGADTIYVSHNHPSGEVVPSEEDKRLTEALKKVVQNHGVKFGGHIIINHTKFGFIDPAGNVSQQVHQEYAKTKTLPVLQKHFPYALGAEAPGQGLLVTSPDAVFELQKKVERDPNQALFFLTDTQNRVLNTVVIPIENLTIKMLQHIAVLFRPAGMIGVNTGLTDAAAVQWKRDLSGIDIRYLDDMEIKNPDGPIRYRSRLEQSVFETPASYAAHESTPEDENAIVPLGKPLSTGAEGINVTDPTLPIPSAVEQKIRRESRALRSEAIAQHPLIEFIKGQGGLRPFEQGVEREEFNASVPSYLKGGKIAPDEMAQMAFDAHLIEEPTTNALLAVVADLPRQLPKAGSFTEEASGNVAQQIANWPRVQPGLKTEIDTALGVKSEDQKLYSERQALRRSLQAQAAAAKEAESATVNRLLNLKSQAVEIVQNVLPDIEQGKFLEAVANLSDVSQMPGFLKKVVARFDAVGKQFEKDKQAAYQENAARLRELERVSEVAAKSALDDLQKVRDTAAALVQSRLPEAVRGKFVTALRDVKNYKDLNALLDRIDASAKKSERRLLVEAIKNSLRRIAATKSIALDYKEAIGSLMRDYLLATPTEKTLARLRWLNEFIAAKKAAGEDVTVPAYVVAQLAKLQAKPLGDMEPAELRDLAAEIQTLADLGKMKFRIRQELDQMRKDRDLNDIVASARPLNMRELERTILPGEKLSPLEKLANLYRTARNSQLHASVAIKPMDYILDTLDGFQKFEGPIYRIFKAGRVDPAWNDYKNLADGMRTEITDLAKKLALTKENFERIGVFAIDQQATGREKLLNNGFTEPEIDSIVLSPAEQQFYKFARARLDSLLPQIREVMKDLYNVPVESVRAYWPFITDWGLMENDPVDVRLGEQFLALKKNAPAGFTKSRVGAGKQAVDIDALSVYLKHTDDVAYLTTVGRHTKYLAELAARPEFKEATGDLGSALVREWVDTLARKGGVGGASRIPVLDRLRVALGPAQLGFHIATALVHVTPLALAPGLIGRWAFVGSSKLVLPQWWRFMNQNFPEIRETLANDPAFGEFSASAALRGVQKASFLPLRAMVKLSRIGIGAGAYLKYLHDHNLPMDFEAPNKDAIVYAQRIMNQAAASFFFKDTPPALARGRLTRNRSLDRLLFQYQNYHLFRWQMLSHMFWDAGIKEARVGQASSVLFWFIFAKLAEVAIRRGVQAGIDEATHYDRKERDAMGEIALETLGEIPFVGQIANSLVYDRMPVPVLNALVTTAEGAKSFVTGKHSNTRERGAVHLAGGVARGLPGIIIPGFPSLPGTAQLEQLILKSIPKKGR